MTQKEIIKHLHEALNSVDITFPYRYVLVEAIEALSQSSLPEGLEEAADKQAFIESPYCWESQPGTFGSTPLFLMSNIRSAFKAGAEWGMNQCPLPEDTTIFLKGVAEGKRLMMEEAVEGYVNYYEDSGGILMAEAQVGCPYHNGDKVKIIVIKEDEK